MNESKYKSHKIALFNGMKKSNLAPISPNDKTYMELKHAFSAHCSRKPLVTAERYCFHERDQPSSRGVNCDVCCRASSICPPLYLWANWDDCLRDRLVCGLSNTHNIKNCLRRKTSTFPKIFSWLQRRKQPLVMRWSLGRRLSLGRCTSLHLLRGDDQRRFCRLVHRHGLAHLQSRRSVSLVVTPVIICNMVSAVICNAMHVARRGTFLAPVHQGSRTGLQQLAFSHLSPSTTTVLA